MAEHKKHVTFKGKILIVGFGAVGQGTLPLILRHIDMPRENVKIITAEDWGREIAQEYGVALRGGAAGARELPRRPQPRAQGGRFSVQRFLRRVQPRADRVLQRARHHVPGRLHRAVGRRAPRHVDAGRAPHQLRLPRAAPRRSASATRRAPPA